MTQPNYLNWQFIIETIPVGIAILNKELVVEWCNSAFSELCLISPESLCDNNPIHPFLVCHIDPMLDSLLDDLFDDTPWTTDQKEPNYEYDTASDTIQIELSENHIIQIKICDFYDHQYLLIAQDITILRTSLEQLQQKDKEIQNLLNAQNKTKKALKETHFALQKAQEELQQLSPLDNLTQIPNRRFFEERLQWEWKRLTRDQCPLSLIMFDIDCFQRYNYYYGRLAGDECLRQISRTAHNILKRPADFLARYNGECFAILLPNTPLDGAVCLVQCLQDSIEQLAIPYNPNNEDSILTISIGISCLIPTLEKDWEELISITEDCLTLAKEKGGNCYLTDSKLP